MVEFRCSIDDCRRLMHTQGAMGLTVPNVFTCPFTRAELNTNFRWSCSAGRIVSRPPEWRLMTSMPTAKSAEVRRKTTRECATPHDGRDALDGRTRGGHRCTASHGTGREPGSRSWRASSIGGVRRMTTRRALDGVASSATPPRSRPAAPRVDRGVATMTGLW